MRLKVFVLFFFLFLLFYLYISNLNQETVKLYVGYGKYYETSVADYVVISFVLGVILSIIVSFFYDIRKSFLAWREDRKGKKKEEFRELFEKARSYDLKGDRDKAIEHLNRLARRMPEMEETYLFLADLHTSMKEFDKASEVLDLAEAQLGRKEKVLLKKAGVHLATKALEKAEKELKDVLGLNESNLDALTMLRDLYISREDWEGAFETERRLRRYIKTDDESRRLLGIRYEKATDLYHRGSSADNEALIKELKDIIGEDKRFVPAYILLAEIYKKTGKLNEAGRVYGRGYSKTGHVVFLLKMEDLYIDRGDPGVILKIYTRILDISPKDHLIMFLYARLCLRLEMIDEAIEMLNTLIAEGKDFGGLHRAIAEAYIHRGELEKAVEEFRHAFPMNNVYIPFGCDNCQARKDAWVEFCENCYSWNTVNVKREEFLWSDSKELQRLYQEENWARGG
jgi:tetratricopeptide (TPR) repeat protein